VGYTPIFVEVLIRATRTSGTICLSDRRKVAISESSSFRVLDSSQVARIVRKLSADEVELNKLVSTESLQDASVRISVTATTNFVGR